MIFAHAIVGSMPLVDNHFSWFWLVGSVIADVDHLFLLYRHRIFSWTKIIDVNRFEDKYNLRFKTKYLHSIFGALALSLPVVLIDTRGAVYFFLAYLLHLLVDLPDIDEKQYFYPLKIKVRGFLPILSKPEIVFTLILVIVLVRSYV